MNCFYCALADEQRAAHGMCSCRRFVCIRVPAGSFYKIVHGTPCRCCASTVICKRHRREHVERFHFGGLHGCFPEIAVESGTTLSTAAEALAFQEVEDRAVATSVIRWNDFLDAVTPGYVALSKVIHRLPSDVVKVDERYSKSSDEAYHHFLPTFFSEGTLERLLALAAREVGRHLEAYLGEWLFLSPEIFSAERFATLWEFLHWYRTGTVPDVHAVRAWLPSDAPPYVVTQVRQALGVSIPDSADAIASWLVGEEQFAGVG